MDDQASTILRIVIFQSITCMDDQASTILRIVIFQSITVNKMLQFPLFEI